MRGVEEMMQSGLIGFAAPPATQSADESICLRMAPQPELGRLVHSEIKSRAARAMLFGDNLFADPAWDMLLDLFAAEHDGRRVQITGVGAPARIPQTTALRWLSALESEGLVTRREDRLDRRRAILRLTSEGCQLMTHYFERKLHLMIQAGLGGVPDCRSAA